MSALSIVLSEEQEGAILEKVERGLRDYVAQKRAAALEDLISFSIEEIALAKGISVPAAKALLTRKNVRKEKFGYRIKRFPLRDLKLIFDEPTIKGLVALRDKRAA
jgi:hypothetical protein